MNIEEYIDNIKNSNLKKSIKNKRLLIINTKLVKDKMYNEIESDIKKFIIEFVNLKSRNHSFIGFNINIFKFL